MPASNTTIAWYGCNVCTPDGILVTEPFSDIATVNKFGFLNVNTEQYATSSYSSSIALWLSQGALGPDNCVHFRWSNWGSTTAQRFLWKLDMTKASSSYDAVTSSSLTMASAYARFGNAPYALGPDDHLYAVSSNSEYRYYMRYNPWTMDAEFIPFYTSAGSGVTINQYYEPSRNSIVFASTAGYLYDLSLTTNTASVIKSGLDTNIWSCTRGPDGNFLYMPNSSGSSIVRVNLTQSLSNPTTTTIGANPGNSNNTLSIGADGRCYILPYWGTGRMWYGYDPVNVSGSAKWKPTISGSWASGSQFRATYSVLATDGCIYSYSPYEYRAIKLVTTGSYPIKGYVNSPYA